MVFNEPGWGIDVLPEVVGGRAIERLARMILHGEKGLPEHPAITMIEGVWRDPPANPAQPVATAGSEA